ncbi:MAG: hypothetical protein LBI48_13105 [Burkholderiaceae bacterium]|nr:hypothetical protein [Burkholderiaceae bacterium]
MKERIKEVMFARHWKTSDVASIAGVSSSAVYQWLGKGSKPIKSIGSVAVAERLEESSGYAARWIATGMGPKFADDAASPKVKPGDLTDEVRIPQFDTGGKMGSSGLVLHDQPGIIREWTVSSEWMHKNVHRITSVSNLVIVTGFGDSMTPIFNSGDPLLVDTGRRQADVDGIYFFRVGDDAFIKRLQRIPTPKGTILRAKSENPRYDPFDITPGMDFAVLGWVVKAWCGEDF